MGKGKASGIDRDYQVLARKIVETLSYGKRLVPYAGDGIDVEIEMGGLHMDVRFCAYDSGSEQHYR